VADFGDSERDPADEIPTIEPIAISRNNDVWALGDHRLVCGDATNDAHVSALMGRERAAMVFADPDIRAGTSMSAELDVVLVRTVTVMSQFRLPGVDFTALVDRERKNIEALAEANRIAFEGWQSLVRRQAEILQETMKKVVADAGQEDAMKKRADLAKEGFEKALSNMRELAEMATKSQKEAFEVVRKRIEENVEGIRNFGKK
jgi:phasin family protein